MKQEDGEAPSSSTRPDEDVSSGSRDDGLSTTVPAEAKEVTYEWHRWAALSMLRGMSVVQAVAVMVRQGIPEDEAAAACALLFSDPTFEAGKSVMQHLRKLESVLDMRQQMQDLSPPAREIDRRSGLSRQAFLYEYYAPNRPVILEDVCDQWPALSLWTPDYLTETLGGAEVEVMADRDADAAYEENAHVHRTRMPFDEYVAKVTATEWSNDLYLVANNKLLESAVAAPLWRDFTLDARYLAAKKAKKVTFLWFGPGGTVTPLHHDLMNIMFHQVCGWKRFILISPLETHCLSNRVGVYSDVNPLVPDFQRFPRFAKTHPYQVTVGPGEALFVPAGWWHHVQALELSVSVSSTSFVFPNKVKWDNPTRTP
jgi:hypothetical protein